MAGRVIRRGAKWGGIAGSLADQADLYAVLNDTFGLAHTWDATKTYVRGEPCIYNGFMFQSLRGGNTGNNPIANPTWWAYFCPPVEGVPASEGAVFVAGSTVYNVGSWEPRSQFMVGMVGEFDAARQYTAGEFVAYNGALWLCSGDPPDVGYTPPDDGSFDNEYWWKPQMFSPSAGLPGQVLTKAGDEWSYYDWRAPATAYTPDAAFTFSAGQITGYNPTAGGVHVRVPPMIGNAVVTSTGVDAFAGCGLVSLELPDTITSIGQGLAYNNNGLRHLKLPNNPELTSLPAYVANNANLASVEIPEHFNSIHVSAYNTATKIVGTPGSYAHKWCNLNGRTFVSNGKPPISPCVMWTAENDMFSANHLHPFYPFLLNGGTWQITDAANANHPGVAACVSHATNINSGAILTLDSATCIQLNGGEELICCFKFHTLNADIKYVIGFGDSRTVATCVDGVLLEGTGTTANFRAYNNSVVTEGGSFTLSQDTWYRLTIRLSDDGTVATCALYNPANSLTISYSLSTGLPTGTGRTLTVLFGSWKTTATLAWMLAVDYVRVSCRRFLDR